MSTNKRKNTGINFRFCACVCVSAGRIRQRQCKPAKCPAQMQIRKLIPVEKRQITITNVPAVISTAPANDFTVKLSCRKTNANASVMTTLSLSTGTTFEASPI